MIALGVAAGLIPLFIQRCLLAQAEEMRTGMEAAALDLANALSRMPRT